MYFYSIEDYTNFKKFSEDLAKTDVDLNPLYRDQKQIFIYILNIFSFFYSHLSQKSRDKEKCDNFSTLSTTYVNMAEKISMYDPMTMICKGFLFFAQGDYDNSEMYFSNISESDKNTNLNKNIIILAKLGRALNSYNKTNYTKAIEYYTSLIKDYDYINENILESLGICYYNTSEIKKAEEIFQKVLEVDENNFKVRTYLSVIELSKFENENDFDKIKISMDNLKMAYLNDEENNFHFLLIHLANIFLTSGKIHLADEVCQKLNNLLELGEMKMNREIKSGKGEKYRRDFEEIKSSVYCINGKIQHFKKNYNEAFTQYRKAVMANQKNIEAQFGLGQIYLTMNNLGEAEKCFEMCKSIQEMNKIDNKSESKNESKIDNNNIEISFQINKYLAFIYARTRRKEVEKTVELFKKALEIKNDDIDCFLELANLLEFRKPEESLKLYEEILIIIKNNQNDANNDSDEKLEQFDQFSLYNKYEILPEILNNIATLKIRLHLLNDVDKILQEALNLIKIKKEKIHINKIADYQSSLLKLDSLDQAIHFNLGIFSETKCEFDEAYKYYKQIVKMNPYFVEAYIKLGELAKQRGNKKKAMEYLQLAVEKHFRKENIDKTKELTKNLNPNSLIANLFPNQKIISVMKKPIDPSLIIANILCESGNENEALIILNNILKCYDEKDPYTLLFIGNIFYEMAANNRNKEDFHKYLNKSLEMYHYSLEADKYNAYAAIGIANVLGEYNLTNQALDTYKLITEKMSNNHNTWVNEALLNMNENKYDKACNILTKMLKRFFKNKCPEIENILAKCLIEIKDFKRASYILKGLIFRHPDNIYYRFNLAICLKQKAEDILLKPERLSRETEDAIQNLEKAIPIFEALFNLRRETISNFKNDKEERIFKSSDFYNKCSEILQFLHITLINARDTLERDKFRENEILKKIEENRIRYERMLENIVEEDLFQKEEIKRKISENQKLSENFKSKFDQIIQMKEEKEKVKEKVSKKKKKEKEDEKERDDEFVEENRNESDLSNLDNLEKKRKKLKKRRREKSEDNLDFEDEEKKGKKLRKKMRTEDDIDLFDEFAERREQDEENVYEENAFKNMNVNVIKKDEIDLDLNIENRENAENVENSENIEIQPEFDNVEMKDYSKNENEEEVDFS